MKRGEDGNALVPVYEDNHLLAALKPSGVPSQPDSSGDVSLDALARSYLREKYRKPGEAYLGLLHRLDRPTSGVVVMARTGKAAARMSDLFRRREVAKRYLAVAEWRPGLAERADWSDWLAPLENGGMRPAGGAGGGARPARLSYRVLGVRADGDRALLEISLLTGVKHQIRCQLAARGCPVVGDFRYAARGGTARPEPVLGGRGILLHAWRLGFIHPVRHVPVEIGAAPPEHWRAHLERRDWPGLEAGLPWTE